MRRLIYPVVFLALLAAPFAWRYLSYYQPGGDEHQAPSPYTPSDIAKMVLTPEAAPFVDEPAVGHSTILLDRSHENDFTLSEFGYLDGRLAARGADVVLFEGGDLRSALRPSSAFVVMTPLIPFDDEETDAVADFVARGGRLLLVGDPSRFNVDFAEDEFGFVVDATVATDRLPLNSLANAFSIVFNGDYLYNTLENEGNFRNIILRREGFAESGLTQGMEQVVFYGSHSVTVGAGGELLLLADDHTWSSATDRPGDLALAVSSHDEHVLALGDINFLTEPYYTVFDNKRFIAAIADFLTATTREMVLADFPYFFSQPVDLVYSGAPDLGPNAFDEVIELQKAFQDADRQLSLSAVARDDHDVLYLGLYNQADDVLDILAAAGITLTIDPPILTEAELAAEEAETPEPDAEEAPGDGEAEQAEDTPAEMPPRRQIGSEMGTIQMAGSALILLNEGRDSRQVVVLAASGEGLERSVDRLLAIVPRSASNVLADCLLQATIAICPTGVADEEVEAELKSGGVPGSVEDQTQIDTPPSDDESGQSGSGSTNGEGQPDYEAIGAIHQGDIAPGDTVEGTLAAEEQHGWTLLVEGPLFVDITLDTTSDDMDLVLALYRADGEQVRSVDSNFSGESEQLLGFKVPAGETYAIVVREFFDTPGDYTLTVTESAVQGGVFIYADDEGDASTTGFTSSDAYVDLLSGSYDVTVWVASEQADLTADDLAGYEMLIWTSGDHMPGDLFENNDAAVLLEVFFLSEGGRMLLTGAVPALFATESTGTLIDLEVAGESSPLLTGFSAGDVLQLSESYETALISADEITPEEGDVALFYRGPGSAESGTPVAIAADDADSHTKLVVMAAPFVALPLDAQELFLDNVMNWFGLAAGTAP